MESDKRITDSVRLIRFYPFIRLPSADDRLHFIHATNVISGDCACEFSDQISVTIVFETGGDS
jgi:hypothetical protein